MLSRVAKRCFSTSGALLTWGETTYGWGRPIDNNYYKPVPVEGFNDVTNVASGPYHLAFTTATSHVYTVGQGKNGRLGNGSQLDAQTPVRVDLKEKIVQLACGQRHTLALTEAGQVFAWGYGGKQGLFGCTWFGSQNPLGNGTYGSSSTPVKVNINNVSQISAGRDFSLALSNGKVYGWGQGMSLINEETSSSPIEYTPVNVLLQTKQTKVRKMLSTEGFAMFLLENGRLYAIGKNIGGATATRHNAKIITDKVLRQLTKINDDPLQGDKIVDFELSANSLILRTESGAVFYSGMHAKFLPARFPTSVQAKSIWATRNSVGIIGQDDKIYFINDPIIEDYDKIGEVMVSDEPALKGAFRIGGSHQLRFALRH